MARFQRRLATVGRLIRFDRRGVGLSDRGSPSNPPTQAAMGGGRRGRAGRGRLRTGGGPRPVRRPPGWDLLMAAAHPERVTSLIILNGSARAAWAPDYPEGVPQDMVDLGLRLGADPDAVEQGYDNLAIIAPSVADDPAFRAWFDRSGNLGATPAMARVMQSILYETDVRQCSPGHQHAHPDHPAGRQPARSAGGTVATWPTTWPGPSSSSFRVPTFSTGWATPRPCSTRSRSS